MASRRSRAETSPPACPTPAWRSSRASRERPTSGDADGVLDTITDFLGLDGAPAARPRASASGTAIILFADIADSTGITERLGDAQFRAQGPRSRRRDAHSDPQSGGTTIEGKLLGDGVLALFPPRARRSRPRSPALTQGAEAGLPLHLGLHAGDVIREDGNAYGGAVNVASRISGLAAPGEVLVSETVRSLARTSAGVRFEDRGEQALKGVGEAVRVWAVVEGEVMASEIRFLTSRDGTRIAYAQLGNGPDTPVISVNGLGWTIDMNMSHPGERARLEGYAHKRRVVTFDRRGTGASERDPADMTFQAHLSDLEAVADRLGLQQLHLVGFGDGGSVAAAYAAERPGRVSRLVLQGAVVSGSGSSDGMIRLILENWSWARRLWATATFPNGPIELQRWYSSALRQSISPEIAIKAVEMAAATDVTKLLAEVQTPTLLVEFAGSGNSSRAREITAIIPDARLLSFPGDITAMWEQDYATGVMAFLEEEDARPTTLPSGTAIILFADIVDSTALTERLGDAAFRAKARDLDAALRTVIREHSGTPIEGKLLGDGVLAVFTSARQAIEAALACGRAGDDAGLPLHLGLHAGDVIREDNNVYGGAVNIASRISGLSAPGEVLVSDTVRSLARTSAGVRFEDRGEQALKGVGEPCGCGR